ncbi:hypothetical protein N7452_008176 [Penicillium brevicompactum]|uniref:Rhodopsin domain-containing protein n=1 Tax=Penicillium brevicompactum TaxID=5074 RepID=A0A9W9U8Z2_PENBR|nr:hypothetical protein N7452_008176 [Penicillium brevicompactum]
MSVTIHNGNSLFLINYATQIISFVAVTPFVALRIFVRRRLNHALGIDDASCVLGWLMFMGYCSSALIYGFAGGSIPPADLDQADYETCVKISYVATILYSPTALFVKTSLLYVMIRIFQPLTKAMVGLYCLIGVVICYYVIITFIKIFMCNPVNAYWDPNALEHGRCLSQPGVIIADSVISFVTDVAILTFPVAFTWTLQMPMWKKVKIVVLLGLGGVAVAFSLYRLVIGVYESNNPKDTVLFMKSILTGNAELGLGLICACLPALNILASYTQRHNFPWVGCCGRQKRSEESSGHIFDWPQADGQKHAFSRSQLSSSARRASTDSARLVASHENGGLSFSENNDIIQMVSLNQHWETLSERSRSP